MDVILVVTNLLLSLVEQWSGREGRSAALRLVGRRLLLAGGLQGSVQALMPVNPIRPLYRRVIGHSLFAMIDLRVSLRLAASPTCGNASLEPATTSAR